MRFTGSGAEIKFWDEGESMVDVASLALRMWNEHRDSAGLPRWEVVGLEVVERSIHRNRDEGHGCSPARRTCVRSPSEPGYGLSA